MEEEGTAGQGAQEKVRKLADRLVAWRRKAIKVKESLSPNSLLRSGLECVLADRIQPAVDDLIELAREPEG